jgi:hypothetical protein
MPSQPRDVILGIYKRDTELRPVYEDIYTMRFPVIAWYVAHLSSNIHQVEPMTGHTIPKTYFRALSDDPTGPQFVKFDDGETIVFESYDEAITVVLDWWQRCWDRDHKDTAPVESLRLASSKPASVESSRSKPALSPAGQSVTRSGGGTAGQFRRRADQPATPSPSVAVRELGDAGARRPARVSLLPVGRPLPAMQGHL